MNVDVQCPHCYFILVGIFAFNVTSPVTVYSLVKER